MSCRIWSGGRRDGRAIPVGTEPGIAGTASRGHRDRRRLSLRGRYSGGSVRLSRVRSAVTESGGPAPARNAQARLMCVDRLTEFGEPRPETGFTAPRTLKWANEVDFNTRDIEPDEPRRADLCYAVEGESIMVFFAGRVGVGVQTLFPPGRYRVRVRVAATTCYRPRRCST
jgi:hypothetical protein